MYFWDKLKSLTIVAEAIHLFVVIKQYNIKYLWLNQLTSAN